MLNPAQYSDDKLIILYILHKIKAGITKEQLAYVIIQNIQINYFDIQLNINALTESGLIREMPNAEDIPVLRITREGAAVLKELETIIPLFTRELLDRYLVEYEKKKQDPVVITAEKIEDPEGDYQVRLTLKEKAITLMQLELNVPTDDTADAICDKWRKETQKIYAGVLNLLNN